jgi:NADPH-dependent curcumin reductase CurA
MIHPETRCETTSQARQCATATNFAARITSVVVTTGIAAYVATQSAMSSRNGSTTVVSAVAHRATATTYVQSQAQDAKQANHE